MDRSFQMKKRRAVWLSLTIILLLIVIISLRIYYVLYYKWQDEPPPKDDDLIFEWREVPDVENAYYYLKQLEPKVTSMTSTEDMRISDMRDGKVEWDHEFLEKILAKNTAAFETAERMVQCKVYQPPRPSPSSIVLTFIPLMPLKKLSRQWYFQALSLIERGKYEEALDIAMKITELGHLVESSPGSIIDYMVGHAIKRMGTGIFQKCAGKTALAKDVLKQYIDRLAECGANVEGLSNSMRAEYGYACEVIDEIVRGRFSLKHFGSKYGLYPERLKPGKLFMPNKTKRMLAETFRELISNLDKSLVDMDIPDNLPELDSLLGNVPLMDRVPIGTNKVGRIIHKEHTTLFYHILESKCRENSVVGMTRLLLALKCYKIDYGQLPETLNELVPEYIDEVPVDDFDGKPLRYSKERKIIYSVGEDMKDSGGPTEKEVSKSKSTRGFLWRDDDPWLSIGF